MQPEDPVALAEAIDKILKDKELQKKFSKAAREHAMQYTSVKIPY